jgi:hypothetical protein
MAIKINRKDNMKNQAEKLMEKFADVSFLNGKEYKFIVYALEKNDNYRFAFKDISYPTPFEKGQNYFVAEVIVEIQPRGGFMYFKHAFQLDLAQIKIELEKIDTEWDKTLILPERIANVLTVGYYEISEYLIDYNGVKDNYKEIANLLYKNKGASVGQIFGV